jgi:hypothetical protein
LPAATPLRFFYSSKTDLRFSAQAFGLNCPYALNNYLHLWAMSQTRNQMALQANHEIMPGCVAKADTITKEHSHPLGERPLVDVSTNEDRNPDYVKLQTELLSLSQNSREIIAEKSGHFVIIDRPDVVIYAISRVVQSVRNSAKL